MQKQVAREKGQQQMFFAVLPLSDDAVGRQKNFNSILGQTVSDRLLVLVTGVNRIPVRLSAVPLG
jgi:hypothetical protein